MPIPLASLLAPISPESPCGADVSYDADFQEVETLLLGKPETQFSAAEPPEWSQIRKRCEELLSRSKHLRIVVALTAALIRTEGLGGFLDGLRLLDGVVVQYWGSVYPLLDPDDNNDPTERLNIITALTTPIGFVGDPYKIVEALRQAPLSASAQMGRFSLHEVQRSQAGMEEAGKPAVSFSQVDAAFRDTPPELLAAAQDNVEQCQALVKGLAAHIGESAGTDRVPNFDTLSSTLREIQKFLASYAEAAFSSLPAAEEEASSALASDSSANFAPASVARLKAGFSGSIGSREDVLRALDAIIYYYAQHEPSSPIPLLLERAKRMVPMDFMAIMEDWAPEAMGQINLIAGIRSA